MGFFVYFVHRSSQTRPIYLKVSRYCKIMNNNARSIELRSKTNRRMDERFLLQFLGLWNILLLLVPSYPGTGSFKVQSFGYNKRFTWDINIKCIFQRRNLFSRVELDSSTINKLLLLLKLDK